MENEGFGINHIISNEMTLNGKELINSFPIQGMPLAIRDFINTCADTFCTPRDFWAGSVLIATALAIGDKMELSTKYTNVPILWMGIVGEVSSGKSESMEFVLRPFANLDASAIQTWKNEYLKYKEIAALSEKERRSTGIERMHRPEPFQYIIKDTTPEALAAAHSINQRGLLLYNDELKSWIDNFNRYSKSGEESFMISSYSRSGMTLNRKSGGINSILHIPNPLILVLGSIQPGLLPDLATDNRQENGFLSRFCFVWPDHQDKPSYNKAVVPPSVIHFWEEFISKLLCQKDVEKLVLSMDAEAIYQEWFNKNCHKSNLEPSGYIKGMYGKLDIMALRIAIILHGMNRTLSSDHVEQITQQEMSDALEITEYFRATGLKVYHHLFKKDAEIDHKQLIKYLSAKGYPQSRIAQIAGVSQPYVNRILKQGL